MPELELVWRYALKGYLEAKQGLSDSHATSEAAVLWSTLVDYSAYKAGENGLPLKLFCTVCRKEYGECRDNYSMHVPEMRIRYNKKQLANWAIELNSLLQCEPLIRTQYFFVLGKPNSRRKPRKHLLAWLEHLAENRV